MSEFRLHSLSMQPFAGVDLLGGRGCKGFAPPVAFVRGSIHEGADFPAKYKNEKEFGQRNFKKCQNSTYI